MVKYTSLDDVPQHIKEKLSRYITDVGGDTFVMHGLPSEVTGAALARYSRAATGIQLTIVNEFLDDNGDPSQEKGSALMDRVLNQFGDDSVAELEGVHAGVEESSQLLTKEMEDHRIGFGWIEQSTRYVLYDKKDNNGQWRYVRPKEIMDSGLGDFYEQVNDRAFEVYAALIPKLSELFRQQLPREKFTIMVERDGKKISAHEHQLTNDKEKKEFNNSYNFTIRCAALDIARCVLPASTKTHVGIFGNGRAFTSLITTLKSHELAELQDRGYALERELNKVIPTFVKRNKEDPSYTQRNHRMRAIAKELFGSMKPQLGYVTLLPEMDHLDELVTHSLFPYTTVSLTQIIHAVKKLSHEQKKEILDAYIGPRTSRRDRTDRGFEAGYPLAFELVGGFAEYRDLQRHRMLTQQRQMLTTEFGFIMPGEVVTVGMKDEVEEVETLMCELNSKLRAAGLMIASQYATCFNHRIRFSMGMNLRAAQHMLELRTGPAGHPSYRAMAMEMARQIIARYPWAAPALSHVDYSDPDNKITRAQEQSRIAGKNLAKGLDGGYDYE